MAPSSLIFVVIVGVWVAFFVQYWVRRREHIATARSVDAFSETMRVLQVRDPHPHVDLDGPPRRSYAVSPTRPVRPQVTVKRAEALLTPADHAWEAPVEHDEHDESGHGGHHWPVGTPREAFRLEITRATRGLTFVVTALATIVYAVLSATGVLRPWAVVVPVAAAVGAFLWVRAGVVAEQAARRSTDARTAPNRTTASRSTASAGSDAQVGAERERVARPAAQDVRPQVTATDVAAPVDRRDAIFDVEVEGTTSPAAPTRDDAAEPLMAPAAAPAARVAQPLLDEDDMPLTWDPVPVPRPTYAMKAQAHRVPAPQAPAAVSRPMTAQPIVADFDDDVPEEFPVRKVVGG